LATLDKAGQVIYCGTFSKTLAPALRIGFAIVPAPLVPAFVRLRTLTDRGTDAFTQATLAEFMGQGLLSPHIRKMRTEYARRRDALLNAMERIVHHATALAAPGGLHMVAQLPGEVNENAAVRACRARELAVSPLRAYYAGSPRMNGLVIGFAATPAAMANEVARRLEAALVSAVEKTAA
jgi:GntR family transcriptional regulator/MocR family aminotransferase